MPLIALIVGVSILLMNEREYLKEGIKMTREEAIDTLKNGLWWDRRRLDEAIDIAISALSTLQAENEKLQKMYQEEKVVCHEIQLELERMKKIMRENGIMVIPSEYPGSTEKWNIQKPRDKKEEL